MPTYTTRFGAVAVPANSAVHIYTAPAGVVSVVRDIVVANLGGVPGVYNVNCVSGGVTFYVIVNQALPALSSDHLDLRQVLLVGDVLSIANGSAEAMTCAVTGYQLST